MIVSAGHNAILRQVEFFRSNFGSAESRWKKDGTRVTIVERPYQMKSLRLQKIFPMMIIALRKVLKQPNQLN